jgi:two-component system sensor histidine kinase/response regulator
MPDFDGMALVEAVQQDRALKSPPRILLLAAHSNEAIGPLFAVTPADAVLSKPLLPAALIETVVGMVAPSARVAQPGTRIAVPRFRALRVLLVEDDMINQQIALELTQAVGIVTDVAANGRIALERLLAADPAHYGLVLMDVQMPEMDGHEVTRRIRADQRFSVLPIIAMTAHAMEADRLDCLAAGMNDHLSKPINPRELYDAIRRWCPAYVDSSDVVIGAAPTGAVIDRGDDLRIEGIDVRGGMARTMGNRALYLQLLARFREDQRTAIGRLRQALAAGDTVLAARQAHTLRGAAGLVGAGALQALAAELEAGIRGGAKGAALQRLVDQLDGALHALLAQLAPFTLR